LKANGRALTFVGALDVAWLVGGLVGAKWWESGGRWSLAVAIGLIGTTTFLGVLLSGHRFEGSITILDSETRTAITVTMVVLYVSILGMFGTSTYDPPAGSLARSLIDQFGTLLTIVLGFYFATTGALHAFAIAKGQPEPGAIQAKTEPGA
jgi:hypothetical protein